MSRDLSKYLGLSLLLLIGAANAANYKPVTAKDGDQFIADFRKTISESEIDLRTYENHQRRRLALDALSNRAQALFGDAFNPQYGGCVKAAGYAKITFDEMTWMTGKTVDAYKLGSFRQMNYQMGIEYWACRMAIDALTPPIPKECLRVLDLSTPNAKQPTLPAHCRKFGVTP